VEAIKLALADRENISATWISFTSRHRPAFQGIRAERRKLIDQAHGIAGIPSRPRKSSPAYATPLDRPVKVTTKDAADLKATRATRRRRQLTQT